MFYKLDLRDFFHERYEELNNNNGIAAMGFITNDQTINLYTDYGHDDKYNRDYIGIGDHYSLTLNVLCRIYSIDPCLVDNYLYKLISIKYLNSPYFRVIAMYFPKNITLNEYKRLVDLQFYYKKVFEKYDIKVAAYEFGNNVVEYGPDIETVSDMNPIIKYGRERLDIDLKRNVKEKILKY